MNKKVDELVGRVARKMYYQHVTSGFRWENEDQWFRDKYLSYTREVLNEPDLAWIDRESISLVHSRMEAVIPLAEGD